MNVTQSVGGEPITTTLFTEEQLTKMFPLWAGQFSIVNKDMEVRAAHLHIHTQKAALTCTQKRTLHSRWQGPWPGILDMKLQIPPPNPPYMTYVPTTNCTVAGLNTVLNAIDQSLRDLNDPAKYLAYTNYAVRISAYTAHSLAVYSSTRWRCATNSTAVQ